ncbi:MAG: hypothetical protein ACKV2Q_16610 [Planctomycetaceae bacterium]
MLTLHRAGNKPVERTLQRRWDEKMSTIQAKGEWMFRKTVVASEINDAPGRFYFSFHLNSTHETGDFNETAAALSDEFEIPEPRKPTTQ